MKLVFIYGPPAAGKYTVASRVAEATGIALFHNHLIVDAVGAVFPFGSPDFVRLRESFWLETIKAAVADDRSIIFTFQPEPSVSTAFPEQVADMVTSAGSEIFFVHLQASRAAQADRIANEDRGRFGKLRDPELLARLQAEFERCEAAMPRPALRIDTEVSPADAAARQILALI